MRQKATSREHQEMTPVELAIKRGVTIDWIYRELRLGKIPAIRRGRRWVIPGTNAKSAAA